ncbi:sensor histidine kinase [Corynebacterium pelargi]|uniref:Sensor histidine kinase LiaS n=1 Tax=Corynebacterium pelargi TaxID=1471400 RepID=A0A410W670_9CORY|nr:sensor histidine kinase [Corynebacterium pelargi]QAU51443.1 Sensor histidine kinase LiaS [Corynebacterium pelargi]GGG79190.1 two-component system, sensory transduction histidine kinase [Corynebacterium pelargi]
MYPSLETDRRLLRAVNVLTSVLLFVALIGVIDLHRRDAILAVVLASIFALVYAYGTYKSIRGGWLELAWLATMTIVWAAMLAVLPVAVYMVFPLFFLYLRALPDIRGVFAVFGVTVVAIVSQWPNLTIGAVMGPTVSAAVVIGINMALQAIWRGAKEREALIEELLETRHQLADSERAAGIAAERQRIAHEIHDTLAQGLSSIQMLLRVAEQDINNLDIDNSAKTRPLQRIELARHTAADNLSEARAIIAALQPAALSKTSLDGALHRVAAQVEGIEMEIDIEGDERQLPMSTEASLLRIYQGAVGNVQKHSQATRCRVTLSYEPTLVRLDVVDNGIGFDPGALRSRPAGLGHIGIDAMRSRAAEQQGELVVESAPGQGCAISVVLPIPSDDPGEG